MRKHPKLLFPASAGLTAAPGQIEFRLPSNGRSNLNCVCSRRNGTHGQNCRGNASLWCLD